MISFVTVMEIDMAPGSNGEIVAEVDPDGRVDIAVKSDGNGASIRLTPIQVRAWAAELIRQIDIATRAP